MEKYEFKVDVDDMRAAMVQPVVFTHRGVCEYCRKPNQLLCNLGGSLVCLECRDGVVKQLKDMLLAPAAPPPPAPLEGVVVTYAPGTAEEARRVRDSHAEGRPLYRYPLLGPRGV